MSDNALENIDPDREFVPVVEEDDRLSRLEAVEARTFGVLELEELNELHGLAGRGHEVQDALSVDEQHACGRGIKELDAALAQKGQQFDHVEVVHQRVGQLDEGAGQVVLSSRHSSVPLGAVLFRVA